MAQGSFIYPASVKLDTDQVSQQAVVLRQLPKPLLYRRQGITTLNYRFGIGLKMAIQLRSPHLVE